jgi:predicted ribosome-associated RNA-binding protein Tma20
MIKKKKKFKIYLEINLVLVFKDFVRNLVTVCEATHTRHDTEDIVVDGV